MRLLLIAIALIASMGALDAQTHTFRLESAEFGVAGEVPAVASLRYDNMTEQGLFGWNTAVCASVDPVLVEIGPEVAIFNGGEPPEFLAQEIVPGQGFYTAVIGTLGGTLQELAPGFDIELHRASYNSDFDQEVAVTFCDITQTSGVVVDNFVVPNPGVGETALGEAPALEDGSITFIAAATGGFVRGDANLDGVINMLDGVDMLEYLFIGGDEPSACLDASDFDASGSINIRDAVGVLFFMFLNGIQPAAPYPDCGAPFEVLIQCDPLPVCP